MYDLPLYIWVLVLIPAIGFPMTTSVALYHGAVATGLGRRAAARVAATAGVVLSGWLVISAALAGAEVYRQDPGDAVPWLPIAAAGFLIALLLATRIPLVSRILDDSGTAVRLTLPHTLRIAGVVFLIVMAQGHLPAAFALPAGLGDMAIGVAAPFVARRLAQGIGRNEAVRFHILGIVDLIVAGSIGFLLLELIEVTPSTAPLLLLPLALILTVAVPLAVALHVVSLTGCAPSPRRVAPRPFFRSLRLADPGVARQTRTANNKRYWRERPKCRARGRHARPARALR
jgi:hypothetical protein